MALSNPGTMFCFAIIFVLCSVCQGSGQHIKRKLETKFLCPLGQAACQHSVNGSYTNLAHTTAVGDHDTFHVLYSTVGNPTILTAQTDLNAQLSIDWDSFLSDNATANSIKFTGGNVYYSYALVMTRLIEYDDVNDTANMDEVDQTNHTGWLFHHLDSLPWANSSELSQANESFIVFHVDTDSDTLKYNENGSLSFKMQTFGNWDRNEKLPHLQYTANSTQFDIILDDVQTNFTNSRFALEMVVISTSPANSSQLNSTRSIDDEHSPGIFELIDWTSQGLDQTTGAYIQWKPVCYMDKERTFKEMNRARQYDITEPTDISDIMSSRSIAYAYYGDHLHGGTLSVTASNVSFGLPKDHFYSHTNYTLWAASIGFGAPPVDTMSSLIMIIISIGLGLPAAFIIFGGLGVCIKRHRDKANASPYGAIQ